MVLSKPSFLLLFMIVGNYAGVPPPPHPPGVVRVPPPVEEYREQHRSQQDHGPEAPPMPSGPHVEEEDGDAVAPPPVAEFRQLHSSDHSAPQAAPRGPQPGPAMPFQHHRPQWGLPVAYSSSNLGAAMDPSLLDNIVYNMDVGKKGLTALKDEGLQACFIDEFSVPFVIPREQRRYYTHTLAGMLVDTPKDRAVFKKMVGASIYDMCHHLRTYWLNQDLLDLFNKLLYDQNDQPMQDNSPEEPQGRVNQQDDEAHSVRRPPPVSLYHVLQQRNQGHARSDQFRAPPASHVRAPPPVDVYRRMHP